jgi:uncharacterized membrane protein YdbT with pleckstrin-like domain
VSGVAASAATWRGAPQGDKTMVANTEQEIMRVHESGKTLTFWLKMIFTLGLYTIPWRSRSWILTDRRLIRHTGVLNIQERSIPLKNIQDVNYTASLLGRMFHYGNLDVESAGQEDQEAMINVGRAADFRAAIFEAMEHYGEEDFPGRRRQ